MTVGGIIQALGMREVRGNIRAVVARVEEGQALIVLRDGQPTAVMLAFDEAQRWQQIERALSALHGLEIYPELARDTAELARIVRRETGPSGSPMLACSWPRSSMRSAPGGRSRSCRPVGPRRRSSRPGSSTGFGLWRGRSAGSAPPGSTWQRPTSPRSRRSSGTSASAPRRRTRRRLAEDGHDAATQRPRTAHVSASPSMPDAGRLRCLGPPPWLRGRRGPG